MDFSQISGDNMPNTMQSNIMIMHAQHQHKQQQQQQQQQHTHNNADYSWADQLGLGWMCLLKWLDALRGSSPARQINCTTPCNLCKTMQYHNK